MGHVTERTDASTASSFLDNDELERTGIDLGTTGRLQLMARLAEGNFINYLDCTFPGWFIVELPKHSCVMLLIKGCGELAVLFFFPPYSFFKGLVCRSLQLHSRLFR